MLQPNPTLYVKNIDWKIKKPLLRRALYSLFTRHGKVLEIITLRRDGLAGQAWIVMDTTPAATAALQALQGFTFFGKDLVIEYARASSDRIAKRDGTYVPRAKRVRVQLDNDDVETGTEEPPPHAPTAETTSATIAMIPEAPPSRFLLAQDLPEDCNEMVLGMLFRQYAGFKEVRMPRPGLAFCEFEDETTATIAKNGLAGFSLTKTDQ
jgi:U2 small nuclear ribonucleoprotein B''